MDNIYTLITGSSSGIGKDIAFYCASLGMNILHVALPGTGLKEVNDLIINQYNVKSDYLEVDLATPDGPEKVFNWVSAKKYVVNFLVNNAGIAGTSVFEESSLKYLDDRILVNIRALVLLTRLFIPLLKKHPRSHILNVGSLSAFYSIPYKSLYAASKAFVVNISKALRSELKGSGISISVVCPNGVRTNQGTNYRIDAHGKIGRLTAVPSPEVARLSIEKTLKGKFLIIPGKINYLLYITGKIIPWYIQEKILLKEFQKEVLVSKNN